MKDRPTARELAAQTQAAEGAWVCPRCGCCDWRVHDSYLEGGLVKRRRACRHCNQVMHTREVPVPKGFRVKVVPAVDEEAAA